MKTKKALRRLSKIEALISLMTERASKGAPKVQEALRDAKAAFARVKEAVNLQASPETKPAKKKPPKWSPAQREAAAERMRLRWAAKKKAEVELQPKADGKARKTASAA
jgi:hypothetical protein